jgi:dihydroflavonol-4-reductase
MKILITGANGLVGSAVARRFLVAGHEVFALICAKSDMSLLKDFSERIQLIEGDILDIPSLENAIQQVDYVIHAAAIVSFAPRDRNNLYKVNVEGTANIVNVCLENPNLKKLCFVSSVAALGRPSNIDFDKEIIIDENQKWEDSPLNSHYAKSKYLAECEIWRGEAEGLNIVIVNPSMILGEGNWEKSSTQIFKYVFDEKKYYTLGLLNYVDINDVAEAIFQLTLSDIAGERFILSAGTITYKNLFDKIANAFGKPCPNKLVNPSITAILWRIEAIRSWITGKAPLITKETAKTSRTKFAYNNEKFLKARANLFNYTEIDETIWRVCEKLALKS